LLPKGLYGRIFFFECVLQLLELIGILSLEFLRGFLFGLGQALFEFGLNFLVDGLAAIGDLRLLRLERLELLV
jgi:hypothetical protein